MVIDCIMDRKEGIGYDKNEFLEYVVAENECFGIFDDLIFALELNKELETKVALSKYVVDNGYNPDICGYIWSVNWCDPDYPENLKSDFYRMKMLLCHFWYDHDPYEFSWAELLEMQFDTSLADDLRGLDEMDDVDSLDEDQKTERLKLMAMLRHMI